MTRTQNAPPIRSVTPSSTPENFIIRAAEGFAEIQEADQLVARVFGPGRYAKSAYRLREQSCEGAGVCFIALKKDEPNKMIGCVRLTPVMLHTAYSREEKFYLLGPIAVDADFQGRGAGSVLMKAAIDFVDDPSVAIREIILVGDEAYYTRFGFKRAASERKIIFPGPADANRILIRS